MFKPTTTLLTLVLAVMMLPIRDPVRLVMSPGGIGNWQTVIQLYTDGTFFGKYLDRSPHDTGEGYPKGTADISDFRGKFTVTAQQSRNVYEMTLTELEVVQPQGSEWISDGTRYRGAAPYGLEGKTTDLVFYTPNAKLTELDPDAAHWQEDIRQRLDTNDPNPLGCYAVYNMHLGHWFFSPAVQRASGELDQATLPHAEEINQRLADAKRAQSNDANVNDGKASR